MKIGIITILKCNNYGAELQAFALQKKLTLMGYDAEIIDYLFYKNPKHIKERISSPFYKFPLKKQIKEYVLPIYERIKSIPYMGTNKLRKANFDRFHSQYTKQSRTFFSYSELYSDPPQYDVYCVGSDQVWNPSCFTSLYPYFLTFAPVGSKKMSYASSFGVSQIPSDAISIYNKCLHGLDSIGVREETGRNLVKKISGRDAVTVADPTLLLSQSEWKQVANGRLVPDEEYILLYILKDSPYIVNVALDISRRKGLKVIRICKGAFRQDSSKTGIVDIMDAGPDDFIGLFANATLVLTNSFHGTAFSTIFQRNFYSIIQKEKDNNSRITDLLERLGNKERIRYEGDVFHESRPIDWDVVGEKLKNFVEFSEEFIYNSIGKDEE